MTLIQIIILFFVLVSLARTVSQVRRRRITRPEFVGWFLFWIALGVAAALPKTTEIAARFVGVGRGADLAIYVGMLVLFFLVFKLFVKIEEVEREITKVVRKEALDGIKKDDGVDERKG